MIVVTGATGRLGGAIVERLLERVPPDDVAVAVRDVAKAQHLAERGVSVRHGNFETPATLPAAFDGASQVLIVSGPADPAPHHAAIRAAVDAGAERVLYTSHQGARLDSAFAPTAGHAQTELELSAAGVAFTALRNGFYAASATQLIEPAMRSGRIVVPADGPVSWTAHDDLADAAVVALTEPGRLDGITPALTGPELLAFADIARVASELTGRTIEHVQVSDAEWSDAMQAAGVPATAVEMLLGMFVASRANEFAVVDPTLEQILGRRPRSFRDVFAERLAAV